MGVIEKDLKRVQVATAIAEDDYVYAEVGKNVRKVLKSNFGAIDPAALSAALAALGVTITDPTNIADCQLWLDASQIAGKSLGDSVTAWSDLSGNAFHATQADVGTREVSSLTVAATSGTFKLNVTNPNSTTSSDIPYNVSPAVLQSTLIADGIPCVVTGVSLALGVTVTLGYDGQGLSLNVTNNTDGTVDVITGTPFVQGKAPGYHANYPAGLASLRFSSDGPTFMDVLSGLPMLANATGVTIAAVTTNQGGGSLLSVINNDASSTDLAVKNWSPFNSPDAKQINLILNETVLSQPEAAWMCGVHKTGVLGTTPSSVPLYDGVVALVIAAQMDAGQSQVASSVACCEGMGTPWNPTLATSFEGSGAFPATAAAKFQIGADGNDYPGINTYVCEIIIYNRMLTAKERRLLLEYLSAKWSTL